MGTSPLKQTALFAAALILGGAVRGQVETVEAPRAVPHWVSEARPEGRLAWKYSAAGAFSPDSSTLAVVSKDKVALVDLAGGAGIRKVLRPRVAGVTDLQIESANFLGSNRLFILASGLVEPKHGGVAPRTPLMAFEWDAAQDALAGKVYDPEKKGEYTLARWFPQIRYLGLYKDKNFLLWDPSSGRTGRIEVPSLTHPPHVYEFSPDGHWLLLAQVEESATADPIVVRLRDHQFVDSLRGHHGTVLGMAFSRDSQKVATACEDGKVRVWSVSDWKLLAALAGHQGPVHWVEFSSDGKWLVSAGEDKTVRIWSAEGTPLQKLEEAHSPVLTVAFSPDGHSVAASTEAAVLIWKQAL